MRSSEDLDFVTDLSRKNIETILTGTFRKTQGACIAQFGPGQSEYKQKGEREEATKVFFIYRPQAQRERIAVKLEFEFLNIFSMYQEDAFSDFISTLKEVTSDLIN